MEGGNGSVFTNWFLWMIDLVRLLFDVIGGEESRLRVGFVTRAVFGERKVN